MGYVFKMPKKILIQKKEDIQRLNNIEKIILNNSNDFIKKIGIKKIEVIRVLIDFFEEQYKEFLNNKKEV